MKIFDYTGLKKGEHLDNRIYCGTGFRLGAVKKTTVYNGVKLLQDDRYPLFWANEWKKDYVVMCIGKQNYKWEWIIVPSKRLAEKGIMRNLRKFGTRHYPEITSS